MRLEKSAERWFSSPCIIRAIIWRIRGPDLMKGLGEKTKTYRVLAGKA